MEIGRVLIIVGIVLVVTGAIMTFAFTNGVPKLPGDIVVKKENFTFYLPIATSIILSVTLSLVFYFLPRR